MLMSGDPKPKPGRFSLDAQRVSWGESQGSEVSALSCIHPGPGGWFGWRRREAFVGGGQAGKAPCPSCLLNCTEL